LVVENKKWFHSGEDQNSGIYHQNLSIAKTKAGHKTTEEFPLPKTNGRSVSYEDNSGFENVVSGVVPGISFNDSSLSAL